MSGPIACLDASTVPLRTVPAPGTPAHATLRALVSSHCFERQAGSVLKLEGEETRAIYYVLSGWLLASKTMAEGHRQIIDVILPGGFLEPASADPDMSALEIEALTDITMALIPRHDWRRACNDHAELADLTYQTVGSVMSRISERMLRLGKGTAETVIAYALCELCLRSTSRDLVEGAMFHIPMTQAQLGDFCGQSAVHVCRTLRRFERKGLLDVTDHMDVVILDVDALARVAEIDLDSLRQEIIPAT